MDTQKTPAQKRPGPRFVIIRVGEHRIIDMLCSCLNAGDHLRRCGRFKVLQRITKKKLPKGGEMEGKLGQNIFRQREIGNIGYGGKKI